MYTYNGGGYIPGIPARDLSDEEVEALGRKKVEASGLYKKERKSRETARQPEAQPSGEATVRDETPVMGDGLGETLIKE